MIQITTRCSWRRRGVGRLATTRCVGRGGGSRPFSTPSPPPPPTPLQPIRVGNAAALREAVHCTGFPPNPDAFPRSLACAEKIGQEVRALRMFGTAAIRWNPTTELAISAPFALTPPTRPLARSPALPPPPSPPVPRSYAWVACGRLTSYTAYDINAWDFCAGMLLVSEAGGRNTNGVDGGPLRLSDRDTVCSNGRIHEELLGEILVG